MADSKAPAKKAEEKKAKPAESKTTVQITLSDVHSDVLDCLRAGTSRHDYVQALVNSHLEAANPVGSLAVDDDLPGNERATPVFRV